MSADAGTGLSELTRLETLQFLNTLGWSFAMGFAALLWAVLEKMEHDRKKSDGPPRKAAPQSPEEATRERLFGRRVVADDDEPASDGGAPSDDGADGGSGTGG